MQPASFRQRISFNDLRKFDFWRYFVKSIWLFFPSLLFIFLSWFCFWKITQGQDLMQITLEKPNVFAYFAVAMIFWVYITWYTSRIIGKIKMDQEPDAPHYWHRLLIQMPRILGFTCFTIIILAFLKLKYDHNNFTNALFYIALFLSFPYYFLLYRWFSKLADKAEDKDTQEEQRKYASIYIQNTYAVLGIPFLIIIFTKSYFFLLLLLFGLQAGLLLLLIFRRKREFIKHTSFFEQTDEQKGFTQQSPIHKKIKGFTLDEEDRFYTRIFIVVIFLGLIFYLSTIFSVRLATKLGSFPFIFLAFGVLLMLGNMVTLFSVIRRFNFHFQLLLLAFIIGLITEPHFVFLPEKERPVEFSKRKTVNEFFRDWIEERKPDIDSSAGTYPVYLVLSDGGASRSGYWAASVLGRLEDSSKGKFSRHLFCLSGASGGSVGNVAFFNLLRLTNNISDSSGYDPPHAAIVQDYLESDFLTYTLARMLGPDVFRHIFPFPFIDDRAASLAVALERASGKNCMLYDSMKTRFSTIVTQRSQPYSLPMLFINTTRMQDGRPGVISNVNIANDVRFNRRIDVLGLLGEDEDMKLSTAVVLGASFPYVSPAGRIDSGIEDSTEQCHYFVDGGYFDNSGSGVVNELLSVLMRDSVYLGLKDKLRFYILHLNNEPGGDPHINKVNPLVNDLAAPIKTLMGSYGSQTTVNDDRLRNFMRSIYSNDEHYRRINLYDDNEDVNYSMNWVISDTLLNAMNRSLNFNRELRKLIAEMR